MRNIIATCLFAGLISALPAAAGPCPGNVIFQDSFASANPSLDLGTYPQSKITIQGGTAVASLLQTGTMTRTEEYSGARYGDVSVCVTVGSVATDKAENEIAGVIFWALDYTSFYSFQVNFTNGQFDVSQRLPSGQWGMPLVWTSSPAIVQGMGKTNALRVQTKGNTATLFINDQQVGVFNGTAALPAGGGQVGFYGQGDGTDTLQFTNFAVASTQSATPLSASAGCPGTVILQDQFPDGDPYMNIQPTAGAQGNVQAGKGQIILLQASYGLAVQYLGMQFGDANICATFNTLPADKAENQMAGIEFWATDYANIYSFLVNPTNGQFQIAQKVGGVWTLLVNSTPNATVVRGMGKTNTLRVQTKGNLASLYINNQLVETISAAPPAGGGVVGFYAQSDATFTTKETWQISNLAVAVQ
jgi:hypothetical protein